MGVGDEVPGIIRLKYAVSHGILRSMAKRYEKTSMGGENNAFRTTCWYDLEQAKEDDCQIQNKVIDKLVRAYWKPVYCYLRHKGRSNELAKDLTQGFFERVVLGKELFSLADKNRGKFRTFLLTALDNYVANEYRSENTKRKMPEGGISRLENIDYYDVGEIPAEMSPDKMFNYTWASQMLDEVLAKVKDECYSSGKEKHWDVFALKVLGPIFDETPAVSLGEICREVGVESESKASNMIVTVKRRFANVLNRTLRNYTSSEEEAEEEFEQLKVFLSGCAG